MISCLDVTARTQVDQRDSSAATWGLRLPGTIDLALILRVFEEY